MPNFSGKYRRIADQQLYRYAGMWEQRGDIVYWRVHAYRDGACVLEAVERIEAAPEDPAEAIKAKVRLRIEDLEGGKSRLPLKECPGK